MKLLKAHNKLTGLTSLCAVLLLLVGCHLALAFKDNDHVPTGSSSDISPQELAAAEQEAAKQNRELRANFKLPKMFNFDHFKTAFKKHYTSAIEELVRMKLYLGRVYRTFLTAVKYKYRQAKYYLAVNSRYDWTQEELAEGTNKVAAASQLAEEAKDADSSERLEKLKVAHSERAKKEEEEDGDGDSEEEEEEEEDILVEPAEVEAELKRIEEHANEPGYEQLAKELPGRSLRKKREIKLEPRPNFELGDLFGRERNQTWDLGQLIESNNPAYEQPDVASAASMQELERNPDFKPLRHYDILFGRKRWSYKKLPVKSNYKLKSSTLLEQTLSYVGSFVSWMAGSKSEIEDKTTRPAGESAELPDVVWVDHRESKCLMPVQDQGRCGSCYAFSMLSYFEWAHCMETGQRVKFSEQYVLDCGQRLDRLFGCKGGIISQVADFVSNFGLELARHYPYKARNEQCPYEEDTSIKSMGYLRVELSTEIRVPLELFEDNIGDSPFVVNVSPKGDFHWYGGGVYDGKHCGHVGTHSVLLIGHGREDGEEYWLLRNSFSEDYGEKGHIRLNKNSNCLHPDVGFAYGSMVSGKFRLAAGRNPLVKEPVHPTARKKAKKEIKNAKKREEAREKRFRFF